MARILVAGCGYVGSALARRLLADGHAVIGLRRDPERLPAGVQPVAADLCDPAGLRAALAAVEHGGIDAVVYAAAAGRGDADSYRRIYVDGLRNTVAWAGEQGMRPPHVLFTSSTAVYAQSDGEWVDENSPTEPTQFSGVLMLEAEAVLAGAAGGGTAVRLGGIYGPGRTRLIDNVRAGRAVIRAGAPRWTNRIHREDAAGVLRHVLARVLSNAPVDAVYIGVDDEPADEADVLRWLATKLDVAAPEVAADEAADIPRTGRAATNKRCRNRRLRESGYEFRYPTYREGYGALIDAMARS